MIEYIKGDLFTTDCMNIAHGCNCLGVMGSGVAKIVKEKYPACYNAYARHVDFETSDGNHRKLLGSVFTWSNDDRVIRNCFTQCQFGDRVRQVDYEAVYTCFEFISGLYGLTEIAMPKIGAGLGGGNWNIIETIIKETLCKSGVYVKVYEL